jgi:predicted translin family RNA/ssDNA-binding protein
MAESLAKRSVANLRQEMQNQLNGLLDAADSEIRRVTETAKQSAAAEAALQQKSLEECKQQMAVTQQEIQSLATILESLTALKKSIQAG